MFAVIVCLPVCLTHRLSSSSLQWQRNKGKSAIDLFDELPLAFQAELPLAFHAELSLETYMNMIEKVGGCNAASPALRLRKTEFLLSDNEATGHVSM